MEICKFFCYAMLIFVINDTYYGNLNRNKRRMVSAKSSSFSFREEGVFINKLNVSVLGLVESLRTEGSDLMVVCHVRNLLLLLASFFLSFGGTRYNLFPSQYM